MVGAGARRLGRKQRIGYAVYPAGGLVALLGFALPFSGGGLPPPGEPLRYYMAWEDPLGQVVLAVVGMGFVLAALLLTRRSPRRFQAWIARAGLGALLLSGLFLILRFFTCPFDAGCLSPGSLLVGIGCLVAGAGVRTAAVRA